MNYKNQNTMKIFHEIVESNYTNINESINGKRQNTVCIFEAITLTKATYKDAVSKLLSIFNELFLRNNYDISDIASFLKDSRSGNVTDYATFILKTIDINKKYNDSNILNIFLNKKNSDLIIELNNIIQKNNKKYIKSLTHIIEDILIYLDNSNITYNDFLFSSPPISKGFIDINYGVYNYINNRNTKNVFKKMKYIYTTLLNQTIGSVEEIENVIESISYLKEIIDNNNLSIELLSDREKDLLINMFGDKYNIDNINKFITYLYKYFIPIIQKKLKQKDNKKMKVSKLIKKLKIDNTGKWISYLMSFEFFIPFKIIKKINNVSGSKIPENKKHIKISDMIEDEIDIDISTKDDILNIEDLLLDNDDNDNADNDSDDNDSDEVTKKSK